MDSVAASLAALAAVRPGGEEGPLFTIEEEEKALSPELGEAPDTEKASDACTETRDLMVHAMTGAPQSEEEAPLDPIALLAAKTQELEACTAKVRPACLPACRSTFGLTLLDLSDCTDVCNHPSFALRTLLLVALTTSLQSEPSFSLRSICNILGNAPLFFTVRRQLATTHTATVTAVLVGPLVDMVRELLLCV